MFNKILSLTVGIALVAMATVIPVLAADQSSTTNVGVTPFLEFSINNSVTCSAILSGGNCPFGNSGLVDLDNTAGTARAAGSSTTVLRHRTNNPGGIAVSAYCTNTNNGGTANCLGNAAGVDIADSVLITQDLQGANVDMDPSSAAFTGLIFRLLDTGTDISVRGADEDVAWGTADTLGTNAFWSSFPKTAANTKKIYDSTEENTVNADAVMAYYIAVDSAQEAAAYTGAITYEINSL